MAAIVARQSYILPRAVAPNVEIFAVGDIHGRPDLLRVLLDEAASEPRRRERRVLLFLGDLIDRGPDSLGVIDLAIGAGERLGADERIALMGNHEAMLRLAVEPKTPWDVALGSLASWLRNGGAPAVRQFANFDVLPEGPEELLTIIRVAMPERLRQWLSVLSAHCLSGSVLFVHAGVNPTMPLDAFLAEPWNVPLAELDEDRHWAWVRWPFLDFQPGPEGFGGYFVVHGHTPNDAGRTASHDEQIARFRLNLDGGSGVTGVAKMAVFRGAEAKVLTAMGPTNRHLSGLERGEGPL
jgi:serine/threonine protein phosphatase 1